MSVDTRAWNIMAGICVASGCGGRVISLEGNEAADESSSAETSVDTVDSIATLDTTTGPECTSDGDCPPGYYCYNQMCTYGGYVDGHLDHTEEYWYGQCYSDAECEAYSLCMFNYCYAVPLPSSCPSPDVPLVIPVNGVALGLSFVDADGDAHDELAVATLSELQLFESGVDMPTISPRSIESSSVDAMSRGHFDVGTAEDLALLVDDELLTHVSNGDGSFAAPSVSPSEWPGSRGALAGAFDGAELDDLLIWADSGAGLRFTGGASVPLLDLGVQSASARPAAATTRGYVLASDTTLWWYTAEGLPTATAELRGSGPIALTSFEAFESYDASSNVIQSNAGVWSLVENWQSATANFVENWGVPGTITHMRSGDFDGDGRVDLALISSEIVYVNFVAGASGCLSSYALGGSARELAVGDHDGDGDDEIAVRMDSGEVWLLDGG